MNGLRHIGALLLLLLLCLGCGDRVFAATCSTAASGGSAPSDWPTYCWFDFSAYNDTLARSAGGQPFAFTLGDGSTLSFTVNVTSSATDALKAIATPSWTGAAVGNTAFLGIKGKPVLYTATSGTVHVTFSGIALAPPPGGSGGAIYSFVAADGESTNGGELLSFTTNGGNWGVLDRVPPISGALYPAVSNTGTTFTETGVAGTVGGYIVGSINPTTVSTVLVGSGLQGAMFAVRFASISLTKALAGPRVNNTDQFAYKISATASGTAMGTGTSTGAGLGPFAPTSSFITSPQSLTVSEAMAAGSASSMAAYASKLTCTNSTVGSQTVLPNNVSTTSYVLGTVAFGDAISCVFTNTPLLPQLSVVKSAPTPGLQVGNNSVYTLTVTNSGTGAAVAAQVKDQLPSNLTLVSAVGANWSCSTVASLVTCSLVGGSIAAYGGTSTIAITVTAPATAAGVNDTNFASIDPTGGTAAPAPGPSCTPAASCASAGPNMVIFIMPVADTGSAVAGTASTPIGNVAANDNVNGAPATLGPSGNATVAVVGTYPTGITLNPTSGAISINTAVQPGNYSIQYQLCDRNSPANCATVTDTVTVAPTIGANPDTGTAAAGTPGIPIASVTSNDTVHGGAVTLGAGGNATIAAVGTYPAGVALNTTTGAVTTAAAVQPGTYTVQYQLCDTNAPPACAITTARIVVTATVQANADTGFASSGTASTPIANVAANDWVDGQPATLGPGGNATVVAFGSYPAGVALNTLTGAITTTTALAPGTYGIQYQLCDRGTPATCSTVTDTITVAVAIVANPATATLMAGTATTAIANVAANDSINGAAVALGPTGNAVLAAVGNYPTGIALNTATGAITLAANVPPGSYSIQYRLCDLSSPPNCATATDTLVLTPASGSVSGSVWNDDIGPNAGNRQRTAGKPGLAGWTVTLINPGTGQPATLSSGAIASTTTGADGSYSFSNVPAGSYSVQFTAPGSNVVWGLPVNGETNDPQANSTVVLATRSLLISVQPGGVLIQQSLPVDPTGIVYDSASRAPRAGAAVTLIGPNGSPVPASNLLPGQQNQVTGASGVYRFDMLGGYPSGVYSIRIAPPGGEVFASVALPPQVGALPLKPGPQPYLVASGVPGPGQAAVYYLQLTLSPGGGSADVIGNNIPLDPTMGGTLLIDKSADKSQAEVGDAVRYRLRVRNTGTGVVLAVKLNDTLPLGFKLIPGTTLIGRDGSQPVKAADPQGTPGPVLSWLLGNLGPGESLEIDYGVRIGVGADRGDGVNRAQAVGNGVTSALALARVTVTGGAFATQACVVGKIYVDCNGNRVQDLGEPGIPGVRMYFEDGTNLTTDENGNFSLCGLRPITHVLKVDSTTLPAGSRLVTLSNRNAGDADSLFVDLRDGELHRADFAEGSCTNKVMDDVSLRHRHEPPLAPLAPAGQEHIGVDFEPRGLAAAASAEAPLIPLPTSAVLDPPMDARANTPEGASQIDAHPTAFREVPGGTLTSFNSNLPVAADEGLWRHSAELSGDARIRVHVSDVKTAADGHSAIHVKVTLLDDRGQRILRRTKVRIETSLGRLRNPAGKEAAAFEMAVANGEAELDLLAPVTPGQALLRVTSGKAHTQGKINFVPELRPLIVAGMVEAGISSQRITQESNSPALTSTGFEDSLAHWSGDQSSSGSFWNAEGRAAGFVKGTIAGDVLLTGAFDSNKVDVQRFFADVDPNQFFPITGDASLVNYDARSTSKLYLRLDEGANHALYGDFQTVAPGDSSWLGSYARTLTGFTAHYETPERRANVFAALESAHQFVDEQPGRGISGPYAVSQANAVANSEIVELLVRDRNQPAVVLSRQTLTRYIDYDFEPFSGRIIFVQPVPSVDENLNPVSIRITYEVDSGGPRYWVDGANGELLIKDGWSVGARYAQDHDPLTPFKLYGADSVWKIDAHTTLTVDAARSDGNQLYSAGLTGGLTPVSNAAGLTALDPSGNAGRVELIHHDDNLDARVYAGKADLTFENANASLSPGRTEEGLHATYKLTPDTQLTADALHSTDETTEAHRTGATLSVETHVWTGGKLETGLAYVNQTYNSAIPAVAQYAVGAVPGTSSGMPLNNTGFGFSGTGLLGSPLGGALSLPMSGATTVEQDYLAAEAKVTQKINERASVYGQYEHTVDGTSGQMAAVGGEYKLSDSSRFYVRHEEIDSLTGVYGLGDGSKAEQTVAGFDTAYMKDGTLYNELRLAGAESGQSAAEALGVRNVWHVAPGWNATTAVERQQVINASALPTGVGSALAGTETATALALGLEYVGSPLWKAAERMEYRFSDVQTNWLSTLAVTRKLNDDWSLIGRNVYLSATSINPGSPTSVQDQDRAQVGLAYRDVKTNVWNVLARFEYRKDYNNDPLIATDSRTQVAAVIANYHPVRAWEFEGQVAAKHEIDNLNAVNSSFNAALLAARALYDFHPRWDVGLLASTTNGGGTRDQGVALELGYRVIDNFWVSVGGIAGRYADTELFSANSSWRGVYLRVRVKFDEKSFRLADPQTNRSLDSAATEVHP